MNLPAGVVTFETHMSVLQFSLLCSTRLSFRSLLFSDSRSSSFSFPFSSCSFSYMLGRIPFSPLRNPLPAFVRSRFVSYLCPTLFQFSCVYSCLFRFHRDCITTLLFSLSLFIHHVRHIVYVHPPYSHISRLCKCFPCVPSLFRSRDHLQLHLFDTLMFKSLHLHLLCRHFSYCYHLSYYVLPFFQSVLPSYTFLSGPSPLPIF